MYVARILYPIKVLGPGDRVGIWFCGCNHHCKGCSNPELWDFQDRYGITLENVLSLVKRISDKYKIDGFTITGGDPFLQYEDLKLLLSKLTIISDDILVYTGYTVEELKGRDLSNISVLIDGKYVEELNDNSLLRGSSNQRIHILQDKYRERYKEYLKLATNQIQNFNTGDGIVSVGIHRADF